MTLSRAIPFGLGVAIVTVAVVLVFFVQRCSQAPDRILDAALTCAAAQDFEASLDQYQRALRATGDVTFKLDAARRIAQALKNAPPQPVPRACRLTNELRRLYGEIIGWAPNDATAQAQRLELDLALARCGALRPPTTADHRTSRHPLLQIWSSLTWAESPAGRQALAEDLQTVRANAPRDPELVAALTRCRLSVLWPPTGPRWQTGTRILPDDLTDAAETFAHEHPADVEAQIQAVRANLAYGRALGDADRLAAALRALLALKTTLHPAAAPAATLTVAQLLAACQGLDTPAAALGGEASLDHAEALARQVLDQWPGMPEAALVLARILRQQERSGEARTILEKILRPRSVRLGPEAVRAAAVQAAAHVELAELALDTALAAAPIAHTVPDTVRTALDHIRDKLDHPGFVHYLQGRVAEARSRDFTALHHYHAADSLFGGRFLAASLRATALCAALEQPGAALQRLTRLAAEPELPETQRRQVLLKAAALFLGQAEYEACIASARQVLSLDAHNRSAQLLVARAELYDAVWTGALQRDPATRTRMLDRAAAWAQGPAPELRLAAEIEFLAGRIEPGLTLLGAYCETVPDDSASFVLLVRTLLANDRAQEADTLLRRALPPRADNAAVAMLLELSPPKRRDTPLFLDLLPLALNHVPGDTEIDVSLYRILHAAGRRLDADAALARAETAAPDRPEVLAARFEAALAAQEWTRACDVLDHADAVMGEPPRTRIWEARLAMARADYGKALQAAERATVAWPLCAGAWALHGELARQARRNQDAETSFRHALALAPNHAAALHGLARLQDAQGEHFAALETLRQATRLNPNDAILVNQYLSYRAEHGNRDLVVSTRRSLALAAPWDRQNRQALARLYLRQREPGQAVGVLEQLLTEGFRDLATVDALATALRAAGQDAAADQTYADYLEALGDRASADDWLGYARALAANGRPGRVEAALEQAIRREQPETMAASLQAAAWHLARGALEQALPLYRRVVTATGRATARYGAAETLLRMQRFAEAEVECAPLRENSGELPRARVTLLTARIAYARGDLNAAERAVEKTLELAPDTAPALLLRAELRFDDVRPEQRRAVRADLDHALALDPDLRAARELLARWQARTGAVAAAIAEMQHLIQADPERADYRVQLGRLYLAAGLYANLEQHLHEAETAFPERVDWPWLRGRLHRARNERELAVETLAEAYTRQPTAAILLDYAEALQLAGHVETALKTITGASITMAATPRLLALRAQLLAATGSDKQAEPLFGMAVQAATDNADALTVILPQLRRALDATAATAVLQPLTERDPTGLIRLHWGDSLIAAGRTHEGETALRTLSRNMPEHVEVRGRALLLIGNLCLTQHRAEVATLAFRDALQALPNHPVVLNNLATALLESPGAEREAVAVAQKALAATAGNTPLRAACLDTLGRAQHRLGLHQAASLSLEESLRIADTVRGRLLLARVFLAADAPGKAKESLIRARALAKGNTDNTALQEDILTTASELGIDIPAGNGQ